MHQPRFSFSVALFAGLILILGTLLTVITVRNIRRDKMLLMQNALTQGYWIARSLEIGHGMMTHDHAAAFHTLIRDIETAPEVRFVVILDANRRVLLASTPSLEGTLWPDELGSLPPTGRMIHRDPQRLVLAFPAFFARAGNDRPHHHLQHLGVVSKAAWTLVGVDATEAQAHYRNIVLQSIVVSLGMVLLGIGAFFFLGVIQKYQLASASLVQLEHIKHHLARFVPGTVQRLIEENPETPLLDKVDREATILFLDIDHYVKITAGMAPEALNRLMETYFSAFLDVILTYGGDINETAGDGLMAIFTAKTPRLHALNAVKAAAAIREQALALNNAKTPHAPDIQVNIGINTGHVLLGATRMQGTAGERFTYTASGMVTNIAARLCGLGRQGDIHLSDTTAALVAATSPWGVRMRLASKMCRSLCGYTNWSKDSTRSPLGSMAQPLGKVLHTCADSHLRTRYSTRSIPLSRSR